jgi:limonene-1,2-epoxide hydrolase
MPVDRVAVIHKFIDTWSSFDLDGLMGLLSEDAVFDNVPMELIVGKKAIADALASFMAICVPTPWALKNIADTGTGYVLAERDDIFTLKDGRIAICPVMGSFKINSDGLIEHWRDYYDQTDWNRQLGLDPDFGRKKR